MVSDSGPKTMYMVRYPSSFGDTVSPIFYLLYLKILNADDRPHPVDSVRFEVAKDADGPWEQVESIPLGGVSLLTIADSYVPSNRTIEMRHAAYRLADQPIGQRGFFSGLQPGFLEDELKHPLKPGSPVYGWVALDSLRHVGLTPGRIYLRLVVGSGSSETSSVSEFPQLNDLTMMELNCGSILVTTGSVDLSTLHLKYFSDPNPPPKQR